MLGSKVRTGCHQCNIYVFKNPLILRTIKDIAHSTSCRHHLPPTGLEVGKKAWPLPVMNVGLPSEKSAHIRASFRRALSNIAHIFVLRSLIHGEKAWKKKAISIPQNFGLSLARADLLTRPRIRCTQRDNWASIQESHRQSLVPLRPVKAQC